VFHRCIATCDRHVRLDAISERPPIDQDLELHGTMWSRHEQPRDLDSVIGRAIIWTTPALTVARFSASTANIGGSPLKNLRRSRSTR
jgi:hypothetical protein